ncbi:hypothetical protein INT47_007263 [Mucor saturninus]|uniref:Uncharacterized protein n=1 Tax=Mucor saturninus TaxID=64648 RepID=A0A8H7R9L5_9FUNG|nr:hypothetical protein INT47_007263 [Mucor saturninus]
MHQKQAASENNTTSKFVLTDEHVVLYIQTFFKVSPRCATGAAPAGEWLQFLELYNEREGHYILTDQQMDTVRPYCQINAEVEMTPEDFIILIYLVRHNLPQPTHPNTHSDTHPNTPSPASPAGQSSRKEDEITPQMSVSTKQLLDSRPRSSRLISRGYYRAQNSPTHPGSDDDFSTLSRKSEYSNDDFSNHHSNPAYAGESDSNDLVETLRRDKSMAIKLNKEYESRIQSLISEHSARINQLQSKYENLSIESGQLKALISTQKNKERERLDKISEMQSVVAESDMKLSNALKKQQSKDEEIDMYREKLAELEHDFEIANKNLADISQKLSHEQETIRALQLDKIKIQKAYEKETQSVRDLKEKLRHQKREQGVLSELVEKQKAELRELDMNAQLGTSVAVSVAEASLALEKADAEIKDYKDKITSLESKLKENERQISEYEEQIHKDEEIMEAYVQSQKSQDSAMDKLKTDFGTQHQKMSTIQSLVSFKDKCLKRNKITNCMNMLSWSFLLYHVLLVIANMYAYGNSGNIRMNPLFDLLERLDDWYTM